MQTITIFDVTHPYILPICFIFIFGMIGVYNLYSLLMLSHKNRLRGEAEKLIRDGHEALVNGEKPVTLEDGTKLANDTAKKLLKENKKEIRKMSKKNQSLKKRSENSQKTEEEKNNGRRSEP